MKVPFWQPSREYAKFKPEIDSAIQGCLERGELMLGFGDEIDKFEKSLAKFLGVKYAIATGAGTHSLYLAYKALGIGPGDEVITTSHTFIATINQIVAVGATPVLVDIGGDGLIDPEEIRKAITPQTKAIVPVHLEGKSCNMDVIMGLAETHELLVIEDAAQAIGAKSGTRRVGTIGDAGCFSFHPAKIFGSIGNMGAVVTNNPAVAEEARQLRWHYGVSKNDNLNVGWGGNFKPDSIHAAVLNVKMEHLPSMLEKRAEVAEKYDKAFLNLVDLPLRQSGRVYQDYVIRCKNKDERDRLKRFLNESGIGTLGDDLIPNHYYKFTRPSIDAILPKTDEYTITQMRLPCNPYITDEEVEYVIQQVTAFFK